MSVWYCGINLQRARLTAHTTQSVQGFSPYARDWVVCKPNERFDTPVVADVIQQMSAFPADFRVGVGCAPD